MLKIRLQRKGKRNQPFFRIIVTEKKNPPRGGRALELLGFLNPLTKEKQLKADRIKYWLGVGAQPSDRVHNLLVDEGVIKEKKKPVHAKPKKKEGEEEPVPSEAEAKPAEEKPKLSSAEASVGKEEPKPAEKPETPKEKPVKEEPKSAEELKQSDE